MQPAASTPEDDLHQAFNEGHTQNFGHIPCALGRSENRAGESSNIGGIICPSPLS